MYLRRNHLINFYLGIINLINRFARFIINQSLLIRISILCSIDLFLVSSSIFYIFWVLGNSNNKLVLAEFINFFTILLIIFIPFNILIGSYKPVSKYINSWLLYKFFIKNFILFLIIIVLSQILNLKVPSLSILSLILFLISVMLSFSRVLLRDYFNYLNKPKNPNLKRTLIYGAGSAGASLLKTISDTSNIVGFIDDDDKLWGRYLYGKRIYNPNKVFLQVKGIEKVLISIPSLSKKRIKEIINFLHSKNVILMKVPSLNQILQDNKKITDLENIKIEDLLGREEIIPNEKLLNQAINNNVVLITGAAGSIGSEIALKVIKLNPKKIILIDINESSLYQLSQRINKVSYSLPDISIKLGDIKFEPFLEEIFKQNKVDVIFHAAAYKHVPIVENNPIEGLRNNIFSTITLFKLSNLYGVKKVVLISSDKAVRPSNIMGCSKRICELIFLYFPLNNKITNYSIVRFGNVIGSSGSVVPLFNKQLKDGGPITLTDPNITRYFMSISEAAELVIQSSTLASRKEIFLLDMGEPIKILELAKKMINLSGMKLKDNAIYENEIEITYTGLRPGEKMYEELLIEQSSSKTLHPLIYKANENKFFDFELEDILKELDLAINKNENEKIFKIIKLLVPEWKRTIS